ncbi:uncharacterized protein [Saccopteryx bilineata]
MQIRSTLQTLKCRWAQRQFLTWTPTRITRQNKQFGLPTTIQSDNGPAFTAQIVQQVTTSLNITWKLHIPYHPQSSELHQRSFSTHGQTDVPPDTPQNHHLPISPSPRRPYSGGSSQTDKRRPLLTQKDRNVRSVDGGLVTWELRLGELWLGPPTVKRAKKKLPRTPWKQKRLTVSQ